MTDNTVVSLNAPQDPLTELMRQGARDFIAQAVEAQLQQLLAQHHRLYKRFDWGLYKCEILLINSC